MRSFLPEPQDDEAELLEGVTEPRLLFGHTHLPFRRVAQGIELINPGSVGLPFDGDERAAYALLHPDGRVEHRRVLYDRAAAMDQVREQFGDAPWTAWAVERLATARA
jgi:diadenosine tetraphosphatase ApaH/serine/threonine PP2A family protein phosphatase